MWLFVEKKDVNDKESDGVIFSSSSNSSSGNNFSHLDWRDDEFSPTFNVPDMDISAGACRLKPTAININI